MSNCYHCYLKISNLSEIADDKITFPLKNYDRTVKVSYRLAYGRTGKVNYRVALLLIIFGDELGIISILQV